MKKPTLVAVLVFISGAVAFAGSMWQFKCENPKCKFEDKLGIGGGFTFGRVSGYCTTCREFVSITWTGEGHKEELKKGNARLDIAAKAPTELGNVWNPATGRIAPLYPCPKCKKPFLSIYEIDRMSDAGELAKLCCPRCGDRTLQVKHQFHYD